MKRFQSGEDSGVLRRAAKALPATSPIPTKKSGSSSQRTAAAAQITLHLPLEGALPLVHSPECPRLASSPPGVSLRDEAAVAGVEREGCTGTSPVAGEEFRTVIDLHLTPPPIAGLPSRRPRSGNKSLHSLRLQRTEATVVQRKRRKQQIWDTPKIRTSTCSSPQLPWDLLRHPSCPPRMVAWDPLCRLRMFYPILQRLPVCLKRSPVRMPAASLPGDLSAPLGVVGTAARSISKTNLHGFVG